MRRLAIALMLPGVIILGFLSWQYVGTNVAVSGSQNEAREAIMQSLEAQDPKSGPVYPWANAAPAKAMSTDVKIIVKQPPKKIKVDGKYVDAVGVISIPSIGVKNEPIVDDFTQAALDEGLVGSMGAAPGTVGNFVVIGHVVTNGEIFRDLGQLRKGDTVTVKTATGTFTYLIRAASVTIVDTDTWVLRDVPSKRKSVATKSVLTLLTCAELFHSNRRIAIFGDLVKGTP